MVLKRNEHPWHWNVQAELEEDVVKLKRLSAAELSSLSKHHSCEVAALQHRLKTQHDEHEQQMISLTARHAKEVWDRLIQCNRTARLP